jgi:hypothetical protein
MKWPSDPAASRRWCQYYEENDLFIRMVVECESAMSIQIECKDDNSQEVFRLLDDKIGFNAMVSGICRDGMINGLSMPLLRLNCPSCLGSIRDPYKEACDHSGGDVSSVEVLNPDLILGEPGNYSMMPNSELQYVVLKRRPMEVYERIAPVIKKLVMEGKPIPLDPRSVSIIEAPSLVLNLVREECSSQVATELSIIWRRKVCEWVKEILVENICRMRSLKTPSVTMQEPNVKMVQKYAPPKEMQHSWEEIRAWLLKN